MSKLEIVDPIPVEDQAAFRAAVLEGLKAADAGQLTPFEPMADWMASWGADHEPPPPK